MTTLSKTLGILIHYVTPITILKTFQTLFLVLRDTLRGSNLNSHFIQEKTDSLRQNILPRCCNRYETSILWHKPSKFISRVGMRCQKHFITGKKGFLIIPRVLLWWVWENGVFILFYILRNTGILSLITKVTTMFSTHLWGICPKTPYGFLKPWIELNSACTVSPHLLLSIDSHKMQL